ncbi:MAG TPA: hypothetical protein VK666_04450, partial [Chryseolinea sp.]|nr:hypothetical protein [Chryseolinea sp.]
VPSYFFNGATLPDPSYPHHDEVNRRIKALSEQIGRPQRDVIKCVLALEPTAVVNQADPNNHGYVIECNQTMFFLGVGTHDEDVSLDAVRMYEYPSCPKAMIAINGASHKRFNTIWAGHESTNDFGTALIKLNLISKPQHQRILTSVFGSCFTGTLGGMPSHLLRFTKRNNFVVNVPRFVDFQGAWKFGFPFPAPANTLTALDAKVTAPPLEALQGSSYKFEQDIKAFFVEKINEGTFTIKIPIDPSTNEQLSNYNHFSFRFARGVDLSSDAGRVEEKNFTIQFFDNNTPLGRPIAGASITTLELRALQAFDEIKKAGETKDFEYSILLQTAEINLSAHLSAAEMSRVTRIDINVIPDATKSPPTSTAKLVFGTIGGAVLGGAIGLGGAALWNLKDDPDESTGRKYLIAGGTIGAVGLGLTALKLLKSDKNAFVFKDFLLTNRQIPVPNP